MFGDLVLYPGRLMMNIFMSVFGCIIIAMGANLNCLEANFKFLASGWGKGCFYIFLGVLLFCNPDSVSSKIAGCSLTAIGVVFLILSNIKRMSEKDKVKSEIEDKERIEPQEEPLDPKEAYDRICQISTNTKKDAVIEAAFDHQEF